MIGRSWPRIASLVLALFPVAALVFVVASLLVRAWPAVAELGLPHLFGNELASQFIRRRDPVYGLLGPIWGTLLASLVALSVALPASLSLAIVSREFRVPYLSRTIGVLMGVLSGIPPIVYALMGVFFMEIFVRPKFGGWELADNSAKAAIMGTLEYSQVLLPVQMPNSTLLGGLMLGLLVIPFMAPLIEDAIKNVPEDLREGSYALGAGRWHTLTRVVLPAALPGLAAAATLGALKAVGEVTIPFFIIGSAMHVIQVPTPPWDVLERVSPLSSAGAGLMGGMSGEGEGDKVLSISVAYFAGFLLLLVAFSIMGLASVVENRLARRMRA